MQVAVPVGVGAMAAILGTARRRTWKPPAATAQTQTGQVVVPANFNGPGQIVIAGHAEAVEAAMELLKARGVPQDDEAARERPLPQPAHGAGQGAHGAPAPRPWPSQRPPAPWSTTWTPPWCSDPAQLRDGLVRQIPGAVRWEALTALLLEQGVTTFFELGPGKVLAGLVKRQAKEAGLEVQACSIAGPEDLQALPS